MNDIVPVPATGWSSEAVSAYGGDASGRVLAAAGSVLAASYADYEGGPPKCLAVTKSGTRCTAPPAGTCVWCVGHTRSFVGRLSTVRF